MRVLSLEMSDILSIEKASIKFEDNGLVLVEGWNYDTQRANGAGKTAIFNCLSFALYDKLPRKITASEIIRRGCRSGSVEVNVLCGEDKWTVKRSRPKGVVFFKNDVQQDITQSEFESFIRLTYSQFLLTIYTPQANSRQLIRFLSSPDSDKKDFLLQLLGLDNFSNAKKSADEIIKAKQAAIDLDDKKLSSIRARMSAYEESLVDTTITSLEISKLQQSLFEINKELIELSIINKPDLSKYSKVEDDVRIKQSEIAQAKAKRSMLHDRYRELNSSISEYDPNAKCGECGSSLDNKEARIAHSEHLSKIKERTLAVKGQIDDVDAVIMKESSINDLAKKLRDKKQQDSSDYQTAQIRINELNSLLRNKTLQIENLQLKLNSNNELHSKINNLQEDVDKYTSNIAGNKRELEIYKTISAVYSPTGAQAYVLDSIVDSFNEVIQKYIDIMSPDMSYILNSFKETSKGDIVAKFSETLTKAGQEVSVGSLSGGEEKGLSLCVDFALLEVLETQFGMSLNPIILDEPFDGLDAAGREIVLDLLENLARNRQIFVIDHSNVTQSSFEKVLRIELRNKVSTINSQL